MLALTSGRLVDLSNCDRAIRSLTPEGASEPTVQDEPGNTAGASGNPQVLFIGESKDGGARGTS